MTDVVVNTTETIINVTVQEINTTVIPETVTSEISVQVVLPETITVAEIAEQGPPGPANNIGTGLVETLLPVQPATASVTGIFPDQVLNLGIPQGIQGEQGDTGLGLIAGGEVGQFIAKKSTADYDVEFKNITESDVTGLEQSLLDLANENAELKKRVANSLSSGLLNGGDPTIVTGESTVSALAGNVLIVRNIVDPENATVTKVPFPALIDVTPDFLLTEVGTFFYINDLGGWEQYPSVIDATETLIPIFWVAHYGNVVDDYGLFEPYPILNIAKQFHDFLEDLGAYNKYGNVFHPNADLTIGRSAGLIIDGGSGMKQNPLTPNRYFTNDEAVVYTNPTYFDGLDWQYPAVTQQIDTLYYNNILTGLELITEGRWVNIYVYMYLDKSYDVLYPQQHYASKEDALSAADDVLLVNEDVEYNIKRCKITVQQGCTDLSDAACAEFTPIDRFGSSSGSGGGGGGETNTMSNAGTEGIGIFSAKVGVDFRTRNLVSKDSGLTYTLNNTNNTIEARLRKTFEDIAMNANAYNVIATTFSSSAITKTFDTGSGTTIVVTTNLVAGLPTTKVLSGTGLPSGTATVCTYDFTGRTVPLKTYT